MSEKLTHNSSYVNDDAELIKLTTGFNKQNLTKNEKDRLDELIVKNELNMHLFEVLTDKRLRKPLRKAIKSMKYLRL
jgi:hypothetical protein